MRARDSWEHFVGNQQLFTSMSLSPLFPSPTSDLHVNNDRGLRPHTVQRQPAQEKISKYRVLGAQFLRPEHQPRGTTL